jgi:class 3 adenylate cyclase
MFRSATALGGRPNPISANTIFCSGYFLTTNHTFAISWLPESKFLSFLSLSFPYISIEGPFMKCPRCQTINTDTKKFCRECGARILPLCPACGAEVSSEDKYCGECGQQLEGIKEAKKTIPMSEGERKHVTVLLSDLSGYTTMSERLDPEEVKEITTRIFGEIAKIIYKYEGFVEKYAGDAVMALFGVPKAHEDDPIRAIRVAREIHKLVKSMSPEIERKTGQPICMHTGMHTGLVVTGEVNLEKGTHGVAGDVINVASRLSGAAGADEILVGQEVFRQGVGYFDFEAKGAIEAKGKSERVLAYKVVAPKEEPVALHGLSILRSELIGRKAEIQELREAAADLRKGKGSIFSICGDAGTGKSRLVEEFKAGFDAAEIQWLEARAYAYYQNIPYFPLIDLLNRILHIKEEDRPENVRKKVELGIRTLVEHYETIIPYIGSLYSLSYPEVQDLSPEFWKAKLREVVKTLLSALVLKAPTVFFLEDLHWADPSFVELLRTTILEIRQPAIVLCVYRPTFSLFTSHQLRGLEKVYREIRLQELSSSEAQEMLTSLLKSDQIPSELRRLVQDKAEGNPFYLEELINSLVESETLIRKNAQWRITRPIRNADISSTVHGIIAGRLDRLERECKRLLQEASVIGRSFLYEILKQVTDIKDQCERCLLGLERLDLIRTRAVLPDLEYIFKHALTQEVAYNGLLKRERQEIHNRIANVMEQLFQERLSESYETLAYHFEKGGSAQNAIYYLMKSGEKSLNKYAVEESHQYFKKAFDIMAKIPQRTRQQEEFLIDLLIKWAFVFHYRGDFNGLKKLLLEHEGLTRSLNDQARLGMFYTQLGLSLYQTGKIKEAYACLLEALELGEKIGNKRVIGYACSHLSWLCPELGRLDEAIDFGKRGKEISRLLDSDEFLFFNSLSGIGLAYYYKGDAKETMEVGRDLLTFAQERSNIRSLVLGHFVIGCSQIIAGDFPSAIGSLQDAIKSSEEPWFSLFPMLLLGFCYVLNDQFDEAENAIEKIFKYSQQFGTDIIRTPAQILRGVITIRNGNPSSGLKILDKAQEEHLKNERKYVYATAEVIIGEIYLQIVKGVSLRLSMAKNIGFLIKNVPSARRKAEVHLNKALRVSEEIGAKGTAALASLDLGLLYKAKGEKELARICLTKAIHAFKRCQAEQYLKQAKEIMKTL